jgi:hypothetical protein
LKNPQLAKKQIAIKKLVDFCALRSLAHGHDTWLMPHVPFWTLRLNENWPLIIPN